MENSNRSEPERQCAVDISWEIRSGKSIYDAVLFFPSNTNCDQVEEVVTVDNCINVFKTDTEQRDLRVRFSAHHKHLVCQVSVLCDARHLEVYGNRDEYLETVTCQLVDSVDDDFVVYKGVCRFPRPLAVCRIDFKSLKSADSLWLYGVAVTVTDRVTLPVPTSSAGGILGLLSAFQAFGAARSRRNGAADEDRLGAETEAGAGEGAGGGNKGKDEGRGRLEAVVIATLASAERRLCKHFDERIERLEERLSAKIDALAHRING